MRDFFLRGSVALGIATAVVTELLSPFHLLRRGPVIAAWLLILALAALVRSRDARAARHAHFDGAGPRGHPVRERLRTFETFGQLIVSRPLIRPKLPRMVVRPLEAILTLACAAIAATVAVTAFLSPPNSADAMAYHLPRVIYWAQAGSVAFFPTPYFNQISLQPLAEYFALHTYLLSGGDRFVNLLTCGAFIGSIVGVSALAGALGAGSRGQAFAALFCATLPNGILQASGAKNEWMLALWLICAAYFAARRNAPFAGMSLGLALATKATAYLFAPPLLLVILLIRRPPIRARSLGWIAAGVLLVNTPQYVRNLRLSGSPMGYDSAQGDGLFRWRNEHPGWKSTVSNLIRHTSEQLGDRRPRWNQAVFRTALALHRALGIDPDDRDTTWPYAQFTPPQNANHEADGNNRWHLLLLSIAALFAVATRKRPWILYGAGLLAAFLLYCFYLKWQPFMVRLELPLFALAAPLAAAFLETLRPAILSILVCLFLVANARLPLMQNWTRPLQGPHSLWVTARDDNYFRDMAQWDYRASYLPAIDLTARSGCTIVGIDIGRNQLEYPFQALLRERNPAVRFVHTGVENASARYIPPGQPRPCAIFCPDCGWVPQKAALYPDFGPPVEFDHFLVFLPSAK
jgi:hypothetical protein